MAVVSRIKRRASPGANGAPASLANAELAYNENDHTLYIGEGTGGAGGSATTIVAIAGRGLGSSNNPVMNGTAAPGSGILMSRDDHVHPSDTSRAPLASPTFTGDPKSVTPPNGDNDTSIATTAFVRGTTLNQLAAPTASVDFNSQKITGLGAPTAATDAVTKQYADGLAGGTDAKPSVRLASTANLTLSGSQTVDGLATVSGTDRVLVKNQTSAPQNGIYIAQSGAWTRVADADAWDEHISAYVWVEEGNTQADSGWLCTVNAGGTLGVTDITWVQYNGAGQVVAGAGLTKSGNQLDVGGTALRIAVNADSIDIDPSYVGQTSIITVGNISNGTWNGTTIAVNKGGSGATTLTGYLKGNGTSPFTAAATIPNTDISGLGTMATQNASAVAITGGTIDGVTLDGGTF